MSTAQRIHHLPPLLTHLANWFHEFQAPKFCSVLEQKASSSVNSSRIQRWIQTVHNWRGWMSRVCGSGRVPRDCSKTTSSPPWHASLQQQPLREALRFLWRNHLQSKRDSFQTSLITGSPPQATLTKSHSNLASYPRTWTESDIRREAFKVWKLVKIPLVNLNPIKATLPTNLTHIRSLVNLAGTKAVGWLCVVSR